LKPLPFHWTSTRSPLSHTIAGARGAGCAAYSPGAAVRWFATVSSMLTGPSVGPLAGRAAASTVSLSGRRFSSKLATSAGSSDTCSEFSHDMGCSVAQPTRWSA
jgi:hypothetical protein